MDLKRMIASAFVRRIVYVIVAALLAFVATQFEAKAQTAQTGKCSSAGAGCSQGVAYNTCMVHARWYQGQFNGAFDARCPANSNNTGYEAKITMASGAIAANGVFFYDLGKLCSARSAFPAGIFSGATANPAICDAGCEMKVAAGGGTQLKVDTRDSSIFAASGTATPTGGTCDNYKVPERTTPKDEFCTTLEGGGYQLCPQKDGKVCVKSNSTGRTYCGNNDYPTANVNPERTEGTAISAPTAPPGQPPPTITPRPGETFAPNSSGSVTNITNNTTTNVTNHTNTGTPNTTPGSGQPGDGSDNPGTPGAGEGDGEGEGPENGTVSGGGSCDSPPAISGGDPVANFATVTLWRLDCQNTANQGDLDQAGTDAAAMANCSLNGIGCDDLPGDLGASPADGTASLEPDEDPLQGSRFSKSLEDIELDDSGFLGPGSCPTISNVQVGSMSIPLTLGPICEVLGYVSGFIMALAYFISFGIIARGFG